MVAGCDIPVLCRGDPLVFDAIVARHAPLVLLPFLRALQHWASLTLL